MRTFISLTILIGFVSLNTVKAGGPWTQPKGKGFFKLSELWIVFDQHYTDVGLLDPNTTTGLYNTNLYAEYGFHDRWTGIFNGTLFSRTYMNNLVSGTTGELIVPGEAINTIGDVDLSVKYSLTRPGRRFPVAATLVLGIPLGTTDGGTQNNLQTGDGEFNQMILVDVGTGFKIGQKVSSYASVYTGFNHRTNGFSEELRYGLEYGLGFFKERLWLAGRLVGVESFKNGDDASTTMSTSIFSNNVEYTSYSLEVSGYVHRGWGISASYAGAFRGEIIAAAPTYSVGVFLDLNRNK